MRQFASERPWAFVMLVGVVATMPVAAQLPAPCETDESYRALDFLLGEWRLVAGGDPDGDGSGGEVVGRSQVEKLEKECLIAETWAFSDGHSGRTYSSFDAAAGVWRRFTVSNHGVLVRASGEIRDGELLVRGDWVSADGRNASWRERLAPAAGGRIRWIAGHSDRRGRSDWTSGAAFEGYYDPVGGRVTELASPVEPSAPVEASARVEAPAPSEAEAQSSRVEAREPAVAPAAAEPALEPAPATGDVTAASARAADAASIERIAMASPMVLRLPLGKVESLPEGYAWISRDTEPYLCEGVTIKRLEVARRLRRGRLALEVELAVHSVQSNRGARIEVDLRRAGQPGDSAVLASGVVLGRVGRSIPEQLQHGSVALRATLPMAAEVFDSLGADAERPELVITLAVEK